MSEAIKTITLRTTEAEPNAALLDQMMARMSEVVHRAAPAVAPMELRSLDELERWAERAARSTMVPPPYKNKPDDIILAVQMGSELGLRPMQSLQNIATINGRPAVWGDAMLALCMGHPLYRGVKEAIEGEGDARVAVCTANRQGDAPKPGKFSVADAKKAGLWGKAGPWVNYPDRMLQMRARGFALRDAFPDKLRGLIGAEEASDYTLESAGISAAPPPYMPEPVASEPDKATIGANALAARFAAVVTAQDYYTILDEETVAKQMGWLKDKRPELFAMVQAAQMTASTTMTDAPDTTQDDGDMPA